MKPYIYLLLVAYLYACQYVELQGPLLLGGTALIIVVYSILKWHRK